VNEAVREAEQSDYHVLLCLASPTGWTDRVYEQLKDGDRARYSRHLSLCLVDLGDGTLVYDESDEVIEANADSFDLSTPDERIEECVEFMRSEYVESVGAQSVVLEEVVESTDFDAHVVREAFERLAEEGAGEMLHVEEYGLSLDFR
jgi:DNA-binding GntR family transcriptional regulator